MAALLRAMSPRARSPASVARGAPNKHGQALSKFLDMQAALGSMMKEHEVELKALVEENKQLRQRLGDLGAVLDEKSCTITTSRTPRGSPLLVETILEDGRRFVVKEPPEMEAMASPPVPEADTSPLLQQGGFSHRDARADSKAVSEAVSSMDVTNGGSSFRPQMIQMPSYPAPLESHAEFRVADDSPPQSPRSPEGELWTCNPENKQPLGIRKGPKVDGPQTGKVLMPGATFRVSEVQQGNGGILFLRLADGSGWVFASKPGAGVMCERVAEHAAQHKHFTVVDLAPDPAEQSLWKCTPVNGQPLGIRKVPELDGEQTGSLLMPKEVFRVSEVRSVHQAGAGDVQFLKLADGRGWVFDHKPAVGTMCSRIVSSYTGVPASPSAMTPAGTSERTLVPLVASPARATGSRATGSSHVEQSREAELWKCTPCNGQPLGIRSVSEIEGRHTGHNLFPGETFRVSECVHGSSPESRDVLFLRLADGRGWVFDHKPQVGVMCTRELLCHPEADPASQVEPGATSSEEGKLWRCSPCNGAPLGIRATPEQDGKLLGGFLSAEETFRVCEVRSGSWQTDEGPKPMRWLKLVGGKGWVFDVKPGVGQMCVQVDPDDTDMQI